jgi:ribonuclease P protein component
MESPAPSMHKLTKKEISQLFLTAKRVVRHPGLDILMAPASLPLGRLLVVTSAKIGNAPDRNRVRRRLKAIFYERRLSELLFDCIVIVKKNGIQLKYDQLENIIDQAYKNIKKAYEV